MSISSVARGRITFKSQLTLPWRSRSARLASNETVAGANPAGSTLSPRSPTRRRRSAQNGDSAGANPAVGTISPCSPTSRGAPLKKEKLRVQILPGGPILAPVAQLAEAANLRSALCRCKSGLEHFWSMYRTSEPGLGANEISRHLLTEVQVLRAPLFPPVV